MRRSEQREHIFKLLFMTQFNSEDEMSDQVSMYFETLGELEEKDQEAMQAKYQHILEHLEEIDQILAERRKNWKPREPKYKKGVLRLFSEHAASPMKGAYLEY